jgi:7-cyano-7-deazaguanine synthase
MTGVRPPRPDRTTSSEWDDVITCRFAVAAVSGGMDSVAMAYLLRELGVDLVALAIDYGQRHRRELACAEATAGRLGVPHLQLDLGAAGRLLAGSALTDAHVAVPDGHYTDESMRITVVPNRNAILLSLATAVAVSRGADAVAFAAHAGDHAIYPDCRPAFVDAFTAMARTANEGFAPSGFHVVAPFIRMSKADIVRIGAELGVPWDETWSCYRGGTLHCGRCGTCVERREAFQLAGVPDPTAYGAG